MKNKIRQIVLLISLSVVSAAIHNQVSPVQINKLDPLAQTALIFLEFSLSESLILDVRPYQKYKHEHFPNAIHFDPRTWEHSFENLMTLYSGEKYIFVYCDKTCGSSKNVVLQLKAAGLENVFFIHDGFPALKEYKELW